MFLGTFPYLLFLTLSLFHTTFNKRDLDKVLVKRNSWFKDPSFCNKLAVLFELFWSKTTLPIVLSNVKVRIWTCFFCKKNLREKITFFQNFNGPLILTGWLYECLFKLFFVVYKRCSFASLTNITQKLWRFKRQKWLQFNDLWKFYRSFKDSSFWRTLSIL